MKFGQDSKVGDLLEKDAAESILEKSIFQNSYLIR